MLVGKGEGVRASYGNIIEYCDSASDELSNLNLLKERVDKSSQLTKGMVVILSTFEHRLARLEETILPVYNETGNLQRRQESILDRLAVRRPNFDPETLFSRGPDIEKTLSALDHVIGFYSVSQEVEPVIRAGPGSVANGGAGFDAFLKALDKLQMAQEYFEKNNPQSVELENVATLFNSGGDTLNREFKELLFRHSKPVPPISLLDLVGTDDDTPGEETSTSSLNHFPDAVTAELTRIAEWLIVHGRDEYMNVYARVRANVQSRLGGIVGVVVVFSSTAEYGEIEVRISVGRARIVGERGEMAGRHVRRVTAVNRIGRMVRRVTAVNRIGRVVRRVTAVNRIGWVVRRVTAVNRIGRMVRRVTVVNRIGRMVRRVTAVNRIGRMVMRGAGLPVTDASQWSVCSFYPPQRGGSGALGLSPSGHEAREGNVYPEIVNIEGGERVSTNKGLSLFQRQKFQSRHETPSRRASKRLQHVFEKKANKMLLRASQTLEHSTGLTLGSRRSGLHQESREDVVDEQEMENYLVCVMALQRLMQSERSLMVGVIPLQHHHQVFEIVIREAMDLVVQDGENIASRAKRCINRHDFAAVLVVFPILKHLLTMKPEFERTVEGCDFYVRSKFASILNTLHGTGSKALEEFVESVRSDPSTQLPKDGTVHELTSNVLVFLEQLLDYVDTIGGVLSQESLYSNALTLVPNASKVDKNKVCVRLAMDKKSALEVYRAYFVAIVAYEAEALTKNVRETRKVEAMGMKFALQRSGLLDLVRLSEPECEEMYHQMIQDHKTAYCQG
uniref:Exocyst complex component 7 n=1 Tax=Timema shepardi TaxID=629360 RepID=A0A7R9B757_TIMSH|nr:unnamed protein product [Timema shepardi]